MLTPQEVSERAFPKASFGGYNMSQVDVFLDELSADYATLYNENAVLKSKMKVLVDKVEEYRSTEDAMRKALMTAQKMADDMVHQAEEKRDEILSQAQAQAKEQIENVRQEFDREQYRLTCVQRSTAAYVDAVRNLHQQQLSYLDNLDSLTPEPVPDTAQIQAERVEDAAQEIDDSVQRLLARAMAATSSEESEGESEAEAGEEAEELNLADTVKVTLHSPKQEQGELDLSNTTKLKLHAPKRKQSSARAEQEPDPAGAGINFDNLQFGRDYEIK